MKDNLQGDGHALTPDSQHRNLDPGAGGDNPADQQDIPIREHRNPGVQGKELPQPSTRGAVNNIDNVR